MKTKLIFLLIITLTFSVISCKKKQKSEEEDELENSFDKAAMLSNYSSNVIIPNIQQAKQAIDSLVSSYNNFTANKTLANLTATRLKFVDAYKQYQHVETFEFGPSENEIVRANFNTFPTDSIQINTNILSGIYDLSTVNNLDAKGFPALDFLLYNNGLTDTQVLNLFINSPNRVTYFSNCVAEMQTKITNIGNAWNNGYVATFNNSTGSQIGSSLGLLVNQVNYQIDLMKNAKVGIPLGKKSLGVIYPNKCEAYYVNNISVQLINECLINIENVYLGRSKSGNDGLGLDDYLDALNAQHTSGTLNAAIKNQFGAIKSKLALVSEPLSQTIINNPSLVDAVYVEMVKLLVLLKTDMPSAMGIVITYQDGDGD